MYVAKELSEDFASADGNIESVGGYTFTPEILESEDGCLFLPVFSSIGITSIPSLCRCLMVMRSFSAIEVKTSIKNIKKMHAYQLELAKSQEKLASVQDGTLEELTKAIEDYILFYNTKRYQLKLKCMTPMEYHTACRGVKNSTLLRSRVEFTQLNILLLFRLST